MQHHFQHWHQVPLRNRLDAADDLSLLIVIHQQLVPSRPTHFQAGFMVAALVSLIVFTAIITALQISWRGKRDQPD